MIHKIILDCDPGHDDAIAILLAAHHPEIELLAITTVAGNQSLEKTTHNALKVCSLANIRNVAVAMRREPAILPRIKAISLMGGAIGVGNRMPAAEFNIWADPEAAAIVFDCERPITMSPLEVTHQAQATDEVIGRLRGARRTVANFAADLLIFFGDTYRNVFGFPA